MGNIHKTEIEAEGRGLGNGIYFPYTLCEGYIPLISIKFNTFFQHLLWTLDLRCLGIWVRVLGF